MTGAARLFFAVVPPPGVQRALGDAGRRLQVECGGRALPPRNIHLTLVFLGEVERERVSGLDWLAAETAVPRFDLEVNRIEYWRHNRIVWAGFAAIPEALASLVAQLERGLSAAGYRFDRRAYVPHVTLLRNARRGPVQPTMRPVAWPVDRYALMESVPRGTGRSYEVRREWPL